MISLFGFTVTVAAVAFFFLMGITAMMELNIERHPNPFMFILQLVGLAIFRLFCTVIGGVIALVLLYGVVQTYIHFYG